MAWIATVGGGVVVTVRVVPRASKDEVSGLLGDALKIKLRAPPVDGKANKALAAFLSERLGIAFGRVRLLAGETSRNKRVLIEGVEESAVRERLVGQASSRQDPV